AYARGLSVTYTPQQAIDFWFEFDDTFQDHVPPRVGQLYATLFATPDSIDYFRKRWIEHREAGTYPNGFRDEMAPFAAALIELGQLQLAVMDKDFRSAADALRQAFEDFGQGVLSEESKTPEVRFRRNMQDRVHQMDGGAATMVGYHRWHAII